MIELRPYQNLGGGHHGWLDTRHHFSFADYRDPQRVHWGKLRVWNDDLIAPGTGFDPHPHQDMEIITWVLDGELEHKDSEGHKGIIYPGLAQRMSAGRIQRLLLEETPVITAYYYDWLSVTGKRVSGVRPSANGQLDLSGTRLLER